MLKWKKKILLVDVEDDYGVDEELTGADAFLAENVTITPFQAETVNRERSGRLGAYEVLHVGKHAMIEFDVPVSGSGTPDVPAPIGKLFRMCRMRETIHDDDPGPERVVYDLIDEDEESGSIHLLLSRTQRHRLLGARGTWGLRMSSNQRLMFHFAFVALYTTPTAVSQVMQDYSAWLNALPVSNANSAISLRGFTPRLRELSMDLGAQTPFRDLIGIEEVGIVDHDLRGSITVEAPDLADKNYFAEIEDNEPLEAADTELEITHGTEAGNIIEVAFPRVQLANPRYAEADGITTLQMDVIAIPTDAGLDEVEIVTR